MTDRQKKTPRQRAQEALGVADRAVKRLGVKVADLTADLSNTQAEYDTALRRREYLAKHPDLATTEAQRMAAATKHNQSSTTPTGDKTA